jgi:hypothetical protein
MDPEQIKAAIDGLTNGAVAKALGLDPGATPTDIMKALDAAVKAVGGDTEADDAPGTAPDPATAEAADPAVAAVLAAATETVRAARVEVTTLSGRVQLLEAERAETERAERHSLVGTLVQLGAETPATAWEGEDAARKLVKRLADEPIVDMRKRVAALRAVPRPHVEVPTAPVFDPKSLTAKEIAACKRSGIAPEEYAARKSRAARRVG